MSLSNRTDLLVVKGASTYTSEDTSEVMGFVSDHVFRTNLDRPGFALLDLGTGMSSPAFRGQLVGLAGGLNASYERRFGCGLGPVSASVFDQQASTEAHLDGGPDASVLLLGYEPTTVLSRVFLVDYTRCATDQGLTPREFLDQFNPTFGPGRLALQPYTTAVDAFRTHRFQILIVNNSSLPLAEAARGMLGVLHKATIDRPDSTTSRVVNSLLLGVVPGGSADYATEEVRAFVEDGTAFTMPGE